MGIYIIHMIIYKFERSVCKMKVLIIGGVAGGASTAARLRRMNENCEIIIFERGPHISFANCGLPYYIGGVITNEENLLIQTPEGMSKRFHIDIRTFNEVISIDADKKEVTVKHLKTEKIYTESYDKLVLSPGASPIIPNNSWLEAENVFTLRNIPDTFAIKNFIVEKNPRHAVVVGGGFIGLEMAENLHHLGISVSIVELSQQIMGAIDFEMSAIVQQYLKKKGIKLYTNDSAQDIQHRQTYSIVQLNSDRKIETNMIVLGIGVKPEQKLAQDAHLALGDHGGICVDKYLKTSNPDIYAIGDAVEVRDFVNGNPAHIPLAGPANKQGRIVANHICGIEDGYNGTQGTAVLKLFDMTIAYTGNNEKLLKKYNIPYLKSFIHSSSNAGYYPGATIMSIKVLFAPDSGKILGAQIVGYDGVDKRIDVLATAIRAGMNVFDLQELELAYAPPFGSAKDPVNMAGYVASNIITGAMDVIHWHDIDSRDKSSTVLLDVRTNNEYKRGTLSDAINIPIDDLRDRIAEIPKDKEIIVFCQVGLRGYLACRILMAHGYKHVKNLSGGYMTYWPAIQGNLLLQS